MSPILVEIIGSLGFITGDDGVLYVRLLVGRGSELSWSDMKRAKHKRRVLHRQRAKAKAKGQHLSASAP